MTDFRNMYGFAQQTNDLFNTTFTNWTTSPARFYAMKRSELAFLGVGRQFSIHAISSARSVGRAKSRDTALSSKQNSYRTPTTDATLRSMYCGCVFGTLHSFICFRSASLLPAFARCPEVLPVIITGRLAAPLFRRQVHYVCMYTLVNLNAMLDVQRVLSLSRLHALQILDRINFLAASRHNDTEPCN